MQGREARRRIFFFRRARAQIDQLGAITPTMNLCFNATVNPTALARNRETRFEPIYRRPNRCTDGIGPTGLRPSYETPRSSRAWGIKRGAAH